MKLDMLYRRLYFVFAAAGHLRVVIDIIDERAVLGTVCIVDLAAMLWQLECACISCVLLRYLIISIVVFCCSLFCLLYSPAILPAELISMMMMFLLCLERM